MSQHSVDILKKAGFLHDLGKILNWSGELHLLDGARVLKYLGFDDPIVGVALYHEPKHRDTIEQIIQKPDCAGLKAYANYDEYALKLGELVDKLMAGFDRIGKEKRTRPIVLRNPLTHLPMDGSLRQFKTTRRRPDDKGPNAEYLRECVRDKHLSGAGLKPLDADEDKKVYRLDDSLANAPLLQVLIDNKDAPFNDLYHALYDDLAWRNLTRYLIPQGHHPPTDTLALWYHMQFSSAMTGLFWAEGFRSVKEIDEERARLRKKPLEVKIGLLYVHMAGLTDYFAGAYRLPDFSGTQAIAQALKRAVKRQLLDARHQGEPFIWEDSFLYQGHDDFLIMAPVEEKGAEEGDYTFRVGDGDPFRKALEQALSAPTVIERAVEDMLSTGKLQEMLACDPGDRRVFGDGRRLREALANLISVELAERCFADFKDGGELTPLFGVIWNRLRAEARGRPPQPQAGLRYYAGDICDCCRVNLAGHDPEPNDPRDWAEVDWERGIIQDEDWGRRPLHYWIFRGTDAPVRGEGDKLCHACLLRRMLGSGASLEQIAPEESQEEGEARIAVIKGNVNRTQWFIGGIAGLRLTTYRKVWFREVCLPPDEVEEHLCTSWVAQNIAYLLRTSRDFGNLAGKLKSVAGSTQKIQMARHSIEDDLPNVPQANRPQFLDGQAARLSGIAEDIADLADFLQDTAAQVQLVTGYLRPTLEAIRALHNEIHRVAALLQSGAPDSLAQLEALQDRSDNLFDALERAFGGGKCNLESLPAPADSLEITRLARRTGLPRLHAVNPRVGELQFIGSPTAAGLPSRQDGPTPSRTMTISWLIDRAMGEVQDLVPDDVGHVVYAEGDEFLVVCRAEEAPQLARRIFHRVVAKLNSLPVGQVEPLSDFLPVTLAMGVVAAKRKHPMYGLLELADRLVRSAKQEHPNHNALDFENVVGGVDETHLDRDRFTGAWLSARPLTLGQFTSLVDDVESLRMVFPASQLHQVAALVADAPPPRADRRTAALAYAWQPHDGEGWERVRCICENGMFQDLMTLWRWPQRKEETEDAGTDS